MRDVAFGIGSNLGDSAALLQQGVDGLAATPGISIDAVSAVFRTAPVGGPDQPDYLNAVVLGRTSLSDAELLAAIGAVESATARVRLERWGPRTLDVDVLAVGQEVSSDPALTLPHPRAHERAFVLVPWFDVDPGAVIAGRGAVAELVQQVDTTGVGPAGFSLRVPGRAEVGDS